MCINSFMSFFLRVGSSLGDAAFYGQFLQGKFICDATGVVPGSNLHFFPSISLSSLISAAALYKLTTWSSDVYYFCTIKSITVLLKSYVHMNISGCRTNWVQFKILTSLSSGAERGAAQAGRLEPVQLRPSWCIWLWTSVRHATKVETGGEEAFLPS